MSVMLLLLVVLPKHASRLLNSHDRLEWLRPRQESFTGSIGVWHVVGFKPYSGSMSNWLEKYARKVEKRHFGVYVELEAMSAEDAASRIEAGEFPDLISFPAGFLNGGELKRLEDFCSETSNDAANSANGTAVPLAASCELMLYYPDSERIGEFGPDEALACGYSFEQFKAKKAPCCITDARGAGDMQRLLSAGKAEYFCVKPYKTETALVQFIGASAGIDEAKLDIAHELIGLLISEKAQEELAALGMLPAASDKAVQYEQSFLAEAYKLITEAGGVRIEPYKANEPSF